MGNYKDLQDIKEMVDRLQGFTKNQTQTIKLVAEQSYKTGQEFNEFQDDMLKMKIKISDQEKIIKKLSHKA